MNPRNGSMFIKEIGFWQSNDLGQTWSDIGAVPQPQNLQEATTEFITPTPSGHDWAICSATNSDVPLPSQHTLCTYDSGKHWTTLPPLPQPPSDSLVPTIPGVPSSAQTPFAYGILLDAQNAFIMEYENTNASANYSGFFRFSPGAAGWQKLTTAPNDIGSLFYAPLPSPGIVWEWDFNNDTYIASYSALS